MKSPTLLTISLSIMALPTTAQITTDGTLGPSINLEGPNFQIRAQLGQQHGPNLFHSFRDFNLNSHESATFSGPNSVQNILSRVTGGNPSHIDGLIRSSIPNAALYFLNPYGIMFGPNARLDVQGSFHASTADYLRLQDGGRFDVRLSNDSVLTVAPIEAFGFLTETQAPITLQSSQLFVPTGKTLSLIGGELLMKGDFPSYDPFETFHPDYTSKLFSEFGRINLASLASRGEVIPTQSSLVMNAQKAGNITAHNTWIGVSGDGAGDLFIRGGHVELKNSELEGDSVDKDSGIINIQVEHLKLQGSEIATDTHGIGQGGQIIIKATETLTLSVQHDNGFPSFIFSGTEGQFDSAGEGGQIDIEARQIVLSDGARISSFSQGPGHSGSIMIKASESLIISSTRSETFQPDPFGHLKHTEPQEGNTGISGLFSHSTSAELNAGNAGSISVQAERLHLLDQSLITASAKNAGGGNISLTTPKVLYLREGRITTSVTSGKGNGGNLTLGNPLFIILDNSQIRATADEGRGGNIQIQSDQLIASPDSLVSASSRLGVDGNVQIESPTVNLDDFLVVLPGGYIDASGQLLPPPCTTARVAKNRFVVKRIAGSPPSPDDFQSNRLVLLPDEERATQKTSPDKSAGQSAPKVAVKMTGCHQDLSKTKSQATPENRVIDEQLF
jgi:filamentous hemagglutinin family protein